MINDIFHTARRSHLPGVGFALAVLMGAFGLTAFDAHACDANNNCTQILVKQLVASDDGNIYVEIAGANPASSCSPHTIDGFDGLQFLTLQVGTENFYAMSAMLRIAHEQQRLLFKISVAAGSSGCLIRVVDSVTS